MKTNARANEELDKTSGARVRRRSSLLSVRSVAAFALALPLAVAACAGDVGEVKPVFTGDAGIDDPSMSVEAESARAAEHFNAGRYGLAVKYYRAAIAKDATSIKALNGLAASYDQMGRYDLSVRYYERALAVDPDAPQTLNNLGYSYLLQGKNDLAVVYLTEAKSVAPSDDIVSLNLQEAEARLTAVDPNAMASLPTRPQRTQTASTTRRVERVSRQVQEIALAPVEPVSSTSIAEARIDSSARPAIVDLTSQPVEPMPKPQIDQVARLPEPMRAPDPMPLEADQTAAVNRAPAEPQDDSDRPQISTLTAIVEVSNGAGRRRMAARMRDYLETQGLDVDRLTNATHFNHQTSTLYYRPGWEAEAEAMALMLPVEVRRRIVQTQGADIRLELGGDLLDFDAALIEDRTQSEPAS